MSNSKKKLVGSKTPASKADVENAVDELAQITEKNFRRIDRRLEGTARKKQLEGIEDRVADRVVTRLQAYWEQEKSKLEDKHQEELDIVTDKKDAPPAWKSIPRRLQTVETEVEKIKDKLEIA